MAACVIRWNRANWGDRGTPVSQHPQTGTPNVTPVSQHSCVICWNRANWGDRGDTDGGTPMSRQCPSIPKQGPPCPRALEPRHPEPPKQFQKSGCPPSNTPPGDPVTFRAIQVSLRGRERGLGGVWGAREVPRRGPQGFQVPPTPQYLLVLAVTALDDGGRQLLLLLQPPALGAATGIGGVNGAGEAPEGPRGVLGCREQGIHTRYLRKAPWTRRAAS